MSEGENPERTINVKVQGKGKEELEKLKEQYKKAEEERNKEIERLKKEVADKKGKEEEAEKYKQMLEDLAVQEFQKKREALAEDLESKRELLGDEKVDELLEKLTKAEEEKDYDMVDRIMYMKESITDALTIVKKRMEEELREAGLTPEEIAEGKEKQAKEKKISTGAVRLLPPIKRGGVEGIFGREFEDPKEFVMAVYGEKWAEEAKPLAQQDRGKIEKLKQRIDNMWRLLVEAEVKGYRQTGRRFGDMPHELILDEKARKILKEKGKL